MGRLQIEEPPQHGVSTGSPVDNAALQARTKSRPSQAGPQATPDRPRKKRVHKSPNTQALLATLHKEAQLLPVAARKRYLERIARDFGVSRWYSRDIAHKLIKKKRLQTRLGVGRTRIRCTGDELVLLKTTLEEHAYQLTFAQIEELTGIPAKTVWRFMKLFKWRQVAKGTRPVLTDDNIAGRLAWAYPQEI